MRTSLLLVSLGLLSTVAETPAAERASHSTLLASSPGEIRFRTEFPAPELREVEVGETRYLHPVWDELPTDGEPGGPGLPVFRVRVALPPRGAPSLEVIAEPRGSLGGVRFPPLPQREPQGSGRGVRPEPRMAARLVEGEAYARYRPAPLAELESVGWERGLRVASVVLRPAQWDPESGRASWAAALEVSIHLAGGGRGLEGSPPRPDRAGKTSWQRTLLNPGDADRFRSALAPDTCAAGIPDVWFDDADAWIRIEVKANGIYGMDRNSLEAAGASLVGVDPRSIRLFAGPLIPDVAWAAVGWDSATCSGDDLFPAKPHVYERPGFCGGFADSGAMGELPIWVPGEGDGSFDSGDLVVFYGLGPDNYRDRFALPPGGEPYFMNPYSDYTIYWLTWESRLPGSPLRMEVVDATPPGGGPELLESAARIHEERNTLEDPSLYLGGLRWERWFWEYLRSDQGAKRFTVSLPHAVAGSTLDALIRLWGARVPTRQPGEASLHHVDVSVNGVAAAAAVWGGTSVLQAITPYDVTVTGMPALAGSEFLFRVPQVPSSDASRQDEVHLTWIDVTYRRQLHLDGGAGELAIDPLPAGAVLRIAEPPSGPPVVLDVSDARRPRRLSGALPGAGELRVFWARAEAGMISVAPEGGLPRPSSLSIDYGPRTAFDGTRWLRDTSEPVDYVIITPEPWLPEADVLADWRRQHLYPFTEDSTAGLPRDARIRVVSVNDIMNEFAWGMWDPAAIRYFLEYALRFYGGPAEDPLSYCLFLGDATNDPRDYGRTGVRDFVPSWEDNREELIFIGQGNVQYVSDDAFARFDDFDPGSCEPDRITDLYLGRITASGLREARDLIVDKVIRSEDSPELGEWRTKAILVADDICQGGTGDDLGSTHIRQTEEVASHIPPVFNVAKIYLLDYGADCSILTKPGAKQDLIQSWSDGAWLVNYVGHGGDVVWADEHVLDLSDTPLLANGSRLPVVGSFSCSVGKFSNPSRDGLGEAHLRSLAGGSLVSLAATHLTSPGSNKAFNTRMLDEMFARGTDRPIPAGVALMEAKRHVLYEADKYVCLGDPGSPPMVPRETLALEGPPRLDRGALASVRVRIPGDGGRAGSTIVEARDSYQIKQPPGFTYELPGALLYRGNAAVVADTALVQFTVPVSLRGGPEGRIAAYAWNDGWDAAGAIAPLEVGGTSVAGNDTVGPVITFAPESEELEPGDTVPVVIEDGSGINLTRLFEFRSILLKVLDRNGLEQLRLDLTEEFTYDPESHTRGQVSFRIPDLESGAYQFSLSATDNFNNRSQAVLDAEVGSAAGPAEFEGIQAAYPNPFDPGVEATQLLFSLSRSADVSIRIYSVSGRLIQKADLAAAAGPNVFTWDGRDQSGDLVANGVYLAQMTAKRAGSEESRKTLERLVVLR